MLFVFKDRNEELYNQPKQFKGTRINTANTLSEFGYTLPNSSNRLYIEVSPDALYGNQPIKCFIRYNLEQIEATFDNINQMIDFITVFDKMPNFFTRG